MCYNTYSLLVDGKPNGISTQQLIEMC